MRYHGRRQVKLIAQRMTPVMIGVDDIEDAGVVRCFGHMLTPGLRLRGDHGRVHQDNTLIRDDAADIGISITGFDKYARCNFLHTRLLVMVNLAGQVSQGCGRRVERLPQRCAAGRAALRPGSSSAPTGAGGRGCTHDLTHVQCHISGRRAK